MEEKTKELTEEEKNNNKIEKEKKIKKEINRLKKIFKDIPKEKKDVSISLINNLAFMTVTLEELQDHINLNGVTSIYQNGENQWGMKKSPEVEIYNTMVKNHSVVANKLIDLLPKEIKQEDDGFLEFVKNK